MEERGLLAELSTFQRPRGIPARSDERRAFICSFARRHSPPTCVAYRKGDGSSAWPTWSGTFADKAGQRDKEDHQPNGEVLNIVDHKTQMFIRR